MIASTLVNASSSQFGLKKSVLSITFSYGGARGVPEVLSLRLLIQVLSRLLYANRTRGQSVPLGGRTRGQAALLACAPIGMEKA